MNRYKITLSGIEKTKKFLNNKGTTAPNWGKKFKDNLKIKSGKLFYNELEVIPVEKVDDLLRDLLIKNVDNDIPPSRDSAYHLLKKRFCGALTRRSIMKFLSAQKTLTTNNQAPSKPKKSAFLKLKNYTYESDLIFVKRTDVIKADPKYKKLDLETLPALFYICATVEKVTGLSRLTICFFKDAHIVTPIVLKHIEEMSKQIGVKPSLCFFASDKGGEFRHADIKKLVKDTKYVKMGGSIENKNRRTQQHIFQILKQRKSNDFSKVVKLSQDLLNNTFNQNHKQTPNEVCKGEDKKKTLKKFNDTRQEYKTGDKRKPFEVGDRVKMLIKKTKTSLEFKGYKDNVWSKEIYTIRKRTKKKIPIKYRIGRTWYSQDTLLKVSQEDEKSNEIISERDEKGMDKIKSDDKKLKDAREEEINTLKKPKNVRRSSRLRENMSSARIHEMVHEGRRIQNAIIDQELGVDKNNKSKRAIIQKKLEAQSDKSKLQLMTTTEMKLWLRKNRKSILGSAASLRKRITMALKFNKKLRL